MCNPALSDYSDLGCWLADSDTLPYVVKKEISPPGIILHCLKLAKESDYQLFGIQDGKMCLGFPDDDSYKKYGKSTLCNEKGTGGFWSNQVYRIKGDKTN